MKPVLLASMVMLLISTACTMQGRGAATAPSSPIARTRSIILDLNPEIAASPLPPSGSKGYGASYPPRFLAFLRASMRTPQDMCVDMWQGDFWEMEDTADALVKHLKTHTQASLNGMGIDKSSSEMEFNLDEYPVSNGVTQLGSHGGCFAYCFDTRPLEAGRYTAQIRVTSVSGRVYTYTWKFQISN